MNKVEKDPGMIWHRVIDPLNPLFGCDVLLDWNAATTSKSQVWFSVRGMRRIDVFVGDRPFQLIAPPGENLGITINPEHLEESPLQDDIVELSTDRPFGLCLSEASVLRSDGCCFRIATFERMSQVAVDGPDGALLASATCTQEAADSWLTKFANGGDIDELVAAIKRRV